jgi:hypothetical protein
MAAEQAARLASMPRMVAAPVRLTPIPRCSIHGIAPGIAPGIALGRCE